MPESPRRVTLGKIGRPHGIRGEVRLFPFNPDSQALSDGLRVHVCHDGQAPVPLDVQKVRYADRFIIVKFKQIDDRDEADALKHAHVELDYEDLPELGEEQFYHVDLIGAPVYVAAQEDGGLPEDAEPVGTVDRMFATGANDVLVVRLNDDEELLAPLVSHAVDLLDFQRHLVVLQPLEIWTPADYETKQD